MNPGKMNHLRSLSSF